MSEQVTVFGANGQVGSQVVAELLARDYQVVAFVHNVHSLPADSRLTVIQGDIYNSDEVDAAIAGSVTVMSALGSWGTPKKDILTVGMTHIIEAMKRHSVSRIVSLTGAEARASGDELSLVHRLMHTGLSLIAGKVLRDGERHIALLEQTDLDWSVVRSPIMKPDVSTGQDYRLSRHRPLPWQTVPRRLVVVSMVDLITGTMWLRKAPYVS